MIFKLVNIDSEQTHHPTLLHMHKTKIMPHQIQAIDSAPELGQVRVRSGSILPHNKTASVQNLHMKSYFNEPSLHSVIHAAHNTKSQNHTDLLYKCSTFWVLEVDGDALKKSDK